MCSLLKIAAAVSDGGALVGYAVTTSCGYGDALANPAHLDKMVVARRPRERYPSPRSCLSRAQYSSRFLISRSNPRSTGSESVRLLRR
jgi:hypothetical protein